MSMVAKKQAAILKPYNPADESVDETMFWVVENIDGTDQITHELNQAAIDAADFMPNITLRISSLCEFGPHVGQAEEIDVIKNGKTIACLMRQHRDTFDLFFPAVVMDSADMMTTREQESQWQQGQQFDADRKDR